MLQMSDNVKNQSKQHQVNKFFRFNYLRVLRARITQLWQSFMSFPSLQQLPRNFLIFAFCRGTDTWFLYRVSRGTQLVTASPNNILSSSILPNVCTITLWHCCWYRRENSIILHIYRQAILCSLMNRWIEFRFRFIKFADAPTIRLLGSPQIDLEEGKDSLILRCEADANPPASIVWRRAGRSEIASLQVINSIGRHNWIELIYRKIFNSRRLFNCAQSVVVMLVFIRVKPKTRSDHLSNYPCNWTSNVSTI